MPAGCGHGEATSGAWGTRLPVDAAQGDAEPPAPSELAPTPEGEDAAEPEVAAPKSETAE